MPRAFTEAQSARVRATLLQVARGHLAAGGLRKVTVASLARAAGVSKGGFYGFFESKEALWIEILLETEAELRATLLAHVADDTLDDEACVRAVVATVVSAVTDHPMLRALADPDEMAWLMRSVAPEILQHAREDDVRFYRTLHRRMKRRGVLGPHATAQVLVALPSAALALAQGAALFNNASFEAFAAFTVDAWVARLTEA